MVLIVREGKCSEPAGRPKVTLDNVLLEFPHNLTKIRQAPAVVSQQSERTLEIQLVNLVYAGDSLRQNRG
jgi:hypothetical protein